VTDADTSRATADRPKSPSSSIATVAAVDRLDVPLGHSIWHEMDGRLWPDVYQGPGKGVIDLICAQHLRTLHHSHQVSNILISLNGDEAGSESYVTATLPGVGEMKQLSRRSRSSSTSCRRNSTNW